MNHKINFNTASFKEFENIPQYDMMDTARYFNEYIHYMEKNKKINFRFQTKGCGPIVNVSAPFLKKSMTV